MSQPETNTKFVLRINGYELKVPEWITAVSTWEPQESTGSPWGSSRVLGGGVLRENKEFTWHMEIKGSI